MTWTLWIQVPPNEQISKTEISISQFWTGMKVTYSEFQIQCRSILIVNSLSTKLKSNSMGFFCLFVLPFTCSQCCCFGVWLCLLQISQKDSRKWPLFSLLGKGIFSQKKHLNFQLIPRDLEGYSVKKVSSENKLAAALIFRAAAFLGCGENEMGQLIEVVAEPRWVNYLDVLSSHPEHRESSYARACAFRPDNKQLQSCGWGAELRPSPVWESSNFGSFYLSGVGAIGAGLF